MHTGLSSRTWEGEGEGDGRGRTEEGGGGGGGVELSVREHVEDAPVHGSLRGPRDAADHSAKPVARFV